MSKVNLNLGITYLGLLVCIGRLAYQPDYSILLGLALFIANLNLRKFFKFLQTKKVEGLDVKLHQANQKIMQLDDDLRKVMLALNFKGVVR